MEGHSNRSCKSRNQRCLIKTQPSKEPEKMNREKILNAAEADATAAMQAMIDKAVGEERERCEDVCDAVSLAAHLATGLAGDDEITTRVGAASYARAAEHIAAAIRKGAKP
jgi:hypothetical protein